MNALLWLMSVRIQQHVQIHLEVILVSVTEDMKEMGKFVEVI